MKVILFVLSAVLMASCQTGTFISPTKRLDSATPSTSATSTASPAPAAAVASTAPRTPAPSANNTVPKGRPNETKEQRDARLAWFRDARFGMFIHWGIYSVPAGTYKDKQIPSLGEWIMLNAKIPVAEYADYAKQFNPVKFDAEEWVKIARDAGMKYIVITAKHHDGFAMFHSLTDPYNIYDATPFKRDPLAELAAACQKYGLKLGFYYSQAQDWHQPGGAVRRGTHWDPAQDGNMDDYLKNVAVPQVKELLTRYGPVAELWFDTPQDMTPERVAQFLPLLKLQPNIILNNRLSADFSVGDTMTPEQRIPAAGFPDGRDWESCMTINDTWGYKSYDTNFKSAEKLLQNLIDIASKGGNYLLNVGPTSEGVIPAPEVERLRVMGNWLKVNGEAIYGTGPTALTTTSADWRCTSKPGKLYLHLFKWPNGKFDLTGVKGKVTTAYLLADPQHRPLTVQQDGDKVSVSLPSQAPDPIASVLCLEFESGS